jgi:8-oxo-dGTP pyrophosphatase MutT (NUDIX family)
MTYIFFSYRSIIPTTDRLRVYSSPMNRRVAVRAIIEKDSKLLCVKHKDYGGDGARVPDFWCTIGGGVDPGEALIPALRREIIEETGIEPDIGRLLYIQQFEHNSTEHLEFFFHVTNTTDFINIDLSKSTHGQKEIELIDFIEPINETLLPKFLRDQPIAQDIATNQPTQFFNYL